MGRRALKRDIKAVHSQARRPSEPKGQDMRVEIIELFYRALQASDIWEAMEYLMAARGLLRIVRKSLQVIRVG